MNKQIMIAALCFACCSCQHTAPMRDVLEVNFPAETEGFVEVTFGEIGELADTLPIVDGQVIIEKRNLPASATLRYLKERDADSTVWLSVLGMSSRWGTIPLGYGHTLLTFDSPLYPVTVGTIADEFGDFEAFDTFFSAPGRFRQPDFLKAHAQSLQALHLLDISWDADTLQMALDCLSESLRTSPKGQELQQLISARKEKGGVAKLFPMWDTEGKAHSFEECLDGKEYMLLNLWASWCAPCRAEIPELMAYNEECRERVAFVSVTIDEDRSAWLKAVADLPHYTWPNLAYKFNGTATGRPRPLLFNNGSVPFFYILDRDGNTLYSSLEQEGGCRPLDCAKKKMNELLNK